MKTINKTTMLKYALLAVFIFFASTAQEAGCPGGGVAPPPPDPEFNMSYNFVNENNAKIYFKPDQNVVIHQIYVFEPNSGISQNINFSYPFIECGYDQVHFLNQYNIPAKGRVWSFRFTGASKTIVRTFSVEASVNIQ